MTHKQKENMLDIWVKEHFNPKAFIQRADVRCGCRYAVATKKDGCLHLWTPFLLISTLEEVLTHLINYNDFIKIKEA